MYWDHFIIEGFYCNKCDMCKAGYHIYCSEFSYGKAYYSNFINICMSKFCYLISRVDYRLQKIKEKWYDIRVRFKQ